MNPVMYNTVKSLRLEFSLLSFIKVFAHELGHSLGMPHDFLKSDNDPRLDESGNSCLGTNGIMSYKARYLIWHQL